MDPTAFKPRSLELDNPFGLDDGWFYFTTGGNIIRWKEGVWEKCAALKERINAVVVDEDKSLSCVSSKGNLHQYQNGKWSKLKLGVTNTVDLLATKKGGLVALAWEDDNSYLVHIGDGKELTRHTFNKRFFAAAELPNGNILLVGEGIHRFDGEDLVQEYDVPAKSVLVHNNIAYAGGSQVGLSGKASLFNRDSDGNWTTIKDPCLEDKDLVSLIVFRGDLYIANVLRLARLQSSGAVEIVREGLARYLGTVNDQLVICSMATASAFNGTEWTTIKE